ncbi:hypothetical protein [Dawidia soli]|uniref:Uncharacterized protein n=1 Tax=Dawidia soli TaxID=2782352 RepID=A0AAP2DD64_9BACT|nr:hypothetical protein [Dawidia soli]MBT1688991.1 hypothetical protein [Dawidia soli]
MDDDGNWFATWGADGAAVAKNYGSEGLGIGISVRDAWSFANGFRNAVVTNHVLGVGRENIDDEAFQQGQFAGDLATVAMAAAETYGGVILTEAGIGGTIASGGTLSVVTAPAAALGVAITVEGTTTAGVALGNVAIHFAHGKKSQSTGRLKGAKKTKHDKGVRRDKQKYNDKKRKKDDWNQNRNKRK